MEMNQNKMLELHAFVWLINLMLLIFFFNTQTYLIDMKHEQPWLLDIQNMATIVALVYWLRFYLTAPIHCMGNVLAQILNVAMGSYMWLRK